MWCCIGFCVSPIGPHRELPDWWLLKNLMTFWYPLAVSPKVLPAHQLTYWNTGNIISLLTLTATAYWSLLLQLELICITNFSKSWDMIAALFTFIFMSCKDNDNANKCISCCVILSMETLAHAVNQTGEQDVLCWIRSLKQAQTWLYILFESFRK